MIVYKKQNNLKYFRSDLYYKIKFVKSTSLNVLDIHKSLSSSLVTVSHKIQSMAQKDNTEDEKNINRI